MISCFHTNAFLSSYCKYMFFSIITDKHADSFCGVFVLLLIKKAPTGNRRCF